MKFRTYCFIIIPLVLFGCGSYHYFNTPHDQFDVSNFPRPDPEMQQKAEKLDGRKR